MCYKYIEMRKKIDSRKDGVCSLLGELFLIAANDGFDMEDFMSGFFCSDVGRQFDRSMSIYHSMGPRYMYEEFIDEVTSNGRLAEIKKSQELGTYNLDIIYWAGYLYKYWHYLTGEDGMEIYSQADFATMADKYPVYHAMSIECAIDNLIKDFQVDNGLELQDNDNL